jgi:crotonobetainyl-CoA:carnitine CoA-transferase CaiB-like acyl-CoA transferase
MDAVPAVGQHTDAILDGLGYGPAQIAALRAASVV